MHSFTMSFGMRCSGCSGIIASIEEGATPPSPSPAPPSPSPTPPSPSPTPSSLVSISSKKSGKCLDIKDGHEVNGASLQVWSCDPHKPDFKQSWLLRGNEVVHQASFGTDFCVDIPDNDQRKGKHLQIWQCGGTPQRSGSGMVTNFASAINVWICVTGILAMEFLCKSGLVTVQLPKIKNGASHRFRLKRARRPVTVFRSTLREKSSWGGLSVHPPVLGRW